MNGRIRWLAGLLLLTAALGSRADEKEACAAPTKMHKEKEPHAPKYRARHIPWVHDEKQAGYPRECSCLAHPSETPAYCGYYVGGGVALGGSYREETDGTWGWDYSGFCFPRRILLYWTHGHRYQGGTGAYASDAGPHVPDLPGLLNPQLYGHKHVHEHEHE
jgi:hypothetical protein